MYTAVRASALVRSAIRPWVSALLLTALVSQSAHAAGEACPSTEDVVSSVQPLARVYEARHAGEKVRIVLLGSESGVTAEARLRNWHYSDRFAYWLGRSWNPKSIAVTSIQQPKRTAAELLAEIPAILDKYRPALLIWETGTVDAAEGVDMATFGEAVESGIQLVTQSGTDLVLLDGQHNGEFGLWSDAEPYFELLEQVVRGYPVVHFPRGQITQRWVQIQGAPSVQNSRKITAGARSMNDCVGRLLAETIIEASSVAHGSSEPGA
jgi:acyl-CoA thioesterase I